MATIVGIRFKNSGKLYYFDPMHHWPNIGDWVVVETVRGQELGEVMVGIREVSDEAITTPLKPVIRVASQDDLRHQEENEKKEITAFDICQKKILEHKLDMKLVRVEYTFDNSKALFYFTANGRVDFRDLVKELASIFKTRIELRQIGVRDEAKMIGGLGPCGRPICCGTFLANFQPVTIRMAKEQNLSLNPIKISGVCGRLMCCLQYEQEGYEKARKKMPKIGKEVLVDEGKGIVWDINVLKETVRVKIAQGDTSEIKEYPISNVRKPNGEAFDEPSDFENTFEQLDEDILVETNEVTFAEQDVMGKINGIQQEKPSSKKSDRSKESSSNEGSFAGNGKKQRSFPKNQNKKNIHVDKKIESPQEKVQETPKNESKISPWQQAVEDALKKAKGADHP